MKYFNELQRKVDIENKILELHDEIHNLENELTILYQPFRSLLILMTENNKYRTIVDFTKNDDIDKNSYILGILLVFEFSSKFL